MSQINIRNLSNENDDGAPDIVGVSTFSATSYIVPPVGNTAQRPKNPQGGDLRFNTDTASLEYFKGDTLNWSQIEMTSPDLNGGARGIWAGGGSPTKLNTIQYVTISTLGDATDFGDLNEVKEGGASCSSRTKAVFAGGYNGPSRTANSSYIIMTSTGNGVDYNDLSNSISGGAGFGSQTRGIIAGGSTGSLINVIESTEFAAGTDWVDFGDATAAFQTGSGCASSTRGVFNLGFVSPTRVNTIDYITIATTGNASDFGDLTTNRNGTGALSNSTRGVWGAGETPTAVNTMDYVTLATTGNATDFGDMLTVRFNIPNDGCSSPTRGLWGGGATPSQSNTIQYITILTTGNAIDFGELTTPRYAMQCTGSQTRGILGGGAGGGPGWVKEKVIDYIEFAFQPKFYSENQVAKQVDINFY